MESISSEWANCLTDSRRGLPGLRRDYIRRLSTNRYSGSALRTAGQEWLLESRCRNLLLFDSLLSFRPVRLCRHARPARVSVAPGPSPGSCLDCAGYRVLRLPGTDAGPRHLAYRFTAGSHPDGQLARLDSLVSRTPCLWREGFARWVGELSSV